MKNYIIPVLCLLGVLLFSSKITGQDDSTSLRFGYQSFRNPVGPVKIVHPIAYYDDQNNVVVEIEMKDFYGNTYFGSSNMQNEPDLLVIDSISGINTQLTRNDYNSVPGEYSALEYVTEDPITEVEIWVDASLSTGNTKLEIVLTAIRELINNKQPANLLSAGIFEKEPVRMVKLSADRKVLIKEFELMAETKCKRGSAINAAGVYGIEYLSKIKQHSNKAIILVTDGKNNRFATSRKMLVALAREFGVKIFVVSVGKQVRQRYCKYVALNTGGKYFDVYDPSRLLETFNELLYNYLPVERVVCRFVYPLPNNFPGERFAKIIIRPSNGYPDSAIIPLPERSYKGEILLDVQFDFDSYIVKPEYQRKIRDLASQINNYLRNNPYDNITIHSFTCPIGKEDYNLTLSINRGEAVKMELYEAGVKDTSRIIVKGYGETSPYIVKPEDHVKYSYLPIGQTLTEDFITNVLKDETQRERARELCRRTHILIVLK